MNIADTQSAPPLAPPRPARLTETAAHLAQDFATRAAAHDIEGSFVAENYIALRSAGLVAAAVPRELGGGGADGAEMAEVLRILAKGCGSTALAFAMHTHNVLVPAWRWTHTPEVRPAVEPLLRRVATENLVICTSGGSDWIGGSGKAEKVEGGYRINARKVFSSSSPFAQLLTTSAVVDEIDGPKVIHFAVPMTAPGLIRLDTWDALGMRGTGSHDIELTDVFVPDDKVALKRKAGEWHRLFQIITTHAFPVIYAVYLGVAEHAAEIALALVAKRPASGRQRRLAGEMMTALTAARLAHRSMVETAAANQVSDASVNAVMIGRRLVEEHGIATVELAMELAGGPGFYRGTGLECCFRDMQGARYHPMHREAQHEYAGAMALGQPTANIY